MHTRTIDSTHYVICTRSELAALVAHASDDPVPKAITTVLFDPGAGVAAATDTHRLLLASWGKPQRPEEAPAGAPSFLVFADELRFIVERATVRGIKRKRDCVVAISVDGARVYDKCARYGDLSDVHLLWELRWRRRVDPAMRFAPYDSAIPKFNAKYAGVSVTIHPPYLADLALIPSYGAPRLHPPAESNGALVIAARDVGDDDLGTGGADWTLVIMPAPPSGEAREPYTLATCEARS